MKKRLIILSDLWGSGKSEWLINYTQILKAYFDIQYYDCCELGGVSKTYNNEEDLHKQFVNNGIDRAVKKLIELEKESVNILAFSVGGTIAWKFGIKSDKINSLICVSSTRLRYETIRPKGEITLFYGNNDVFKPEIEWLDDMELNYDVLIDKEHQVYTNSEFAKQLCKRIIKTTKLTDNILSKNSDVSMNTKRYITKGEGLPNWPNPISHAVVVNNMCFVSGQLAVNNGGAYVSGTIMEEGELAFSNFFAALKAADFEKEDVVFIDIAFDNLKDLPEIDKLYMKLFPENKRPARTIYQAEALPFGGKIKITGTAVKELL